MWLFLVFLAVPLIEITLFIQIGSLIGLSWTLVTVVLTAVLGAWLVRNQGLATLGRLRTTYYDGRDPTEVLVHGAMILFSGALLLTPGFFTDVVGFSLLVPAIRTAVFIAIRSRVSIQTSGHGFDPEERVGDVIDAEYVDLNNEENSPDDPSGWTKH